MKTKSPNFVGKHILMIVENLAVPFDSRVWQEATALRQSGAEVSIICPTMKGYTKRYECLEGIEIYRHSLATEGDGALGYLFEYGSALFWWFYLSLRIYFRKPFQVIHGCNPPDLIFIVALPFKLFGVKYVFDHHDANPELFIAKFGRKGFFYHLMVWLERATFSVADYSIATNQSYREIALKRGGMRPEKVAVVRSGPNLDRMKIRPANKVHKKGRAYLVGYLGTIGEQEGIDLLLDAAKQITAVRQDVQFAIIGAGTSLEAMKALSVQMNLQNYVTFYGRLPDDQMLDILNTADVCVNPDRPTEMNDISTMNKIMEYMALKKPIVQFDLKEGRFSAQDASLYADHTKPDDFAQKILELINSKPLRVQMGEYGYHQVVNQLSWTYERKKLLTLYHNVLAFNQRQSMLVSVLKLFSPPSRAGKAVSKM
ncbi:glycosyltransferase family 4 protein [Larkinella terrae]|uniref:Glycosyltransferase n=1 Tax=Larkinella terrae TaxID=2025311 RepID=A0A7K0EVL6_9BACT|nr:glycosyltransferase family 4 protein [Larkinella terrae]MRS65541.1 glycosyltransferase [Larkinella terrae]